MELLFPVPSRSFDQDCTRVSSQVKLQIGNMVVVDAVRLMNGDCVVMVEMEMEVMV